MPPQITRQRTKELHAARRNRHTIGKTRSKTANARAAARAAYIHPGSIVILTPDDDDDDDDDDAAAA